MKPIGADKAFLQYRPDLDGLRAISCLLVFFYHVNLSKSWHGRFPWIALLQGWVGVYVFFVLSGFLITSLLIGEERKLGRIHFGRFLARREFRIVPAYYATVALYGVLCLTPIARQYSAQFRAGFWYWILYCGDIATQMKDVGTLFGHSWSLAIEQRFYFIWPIALFGFYRSRRFRVAIFVIAACAVHFLPWGNAYLALVMGSAVAFLYADRLGASFLQKLPAAVPAAALLLWVAVLHWHPDLIVPFSLLAALLVYHLTVRQSMVSRFLAIPPLVWLGQRSYSFYLLHVICLNIALRLVDSSSVHGALAAIALGLALTTIASALSYRLIEEPFRRLGKRLADPKPASLHAVTP
ncbi:MAG: acyltransferase [Acidobacteriaceae bacterium]|jgi:peptidoglycan/LPS O-acetylase OafA/YrhL